MKGFICNTIIIIAIFFPSVLSAHCRQHNPDKNIQCVAFSLKNKLNVVIISDPNTQISSSSLTVAVGQRNATKHYDGLPHLLEHASFFGSKSYPKNNEFQDFITSHNGWTNASTRTDNTRYHFQVNSNGFIEAFLRFSDLIQHPLLTDKAIEIALSAVNSEFQSSSQSNWQGTLSVIRANSNPKNSWSKFGIGNKKSLNHSIQTIKKQLTVFHDKHYVSNNMNLVLYSNLEISQLKELVISTFGSLKPHQVTTPKEPDLLTKQQRAKKIFVQNNNNSHSLDLRFEVPSIIDNSTYSIRALFNHLINHKGNHSLYAYLNKKGYIYDISINNQGDSKTGIANVYFSLTEKGVKNLDNVIWSFYSYITFLMHAEIPNYIFEELNQLSRYQLSNSDLMEIGDWVGNISDIMHHYPHEAWDKAQLITLDKRDKNAFKAFLAHIIPENSQAFIATNKVDFQHYTKHYNMGYKLINIEPKLIDYWKNTPQSNNFTLPIKNPFIRFSPTTKVNFIEEKTIDNSLDGITTIYDITKQYGTNLSSISLQLNANNMANSMSELAVLQIKSQQISSSLGDMGYYASLAGYYYSAEPKNHGIRINIDGYNNNLLTVLESLWPSFLDVVNEKQFQKLKLSVTNNLTQKLTKQPIEQTRSAMDELFFNSQYVPTKQLVETIKNTSYKAYCEQIAVMTQSLSLIAVLSGNIDKDTFRQFIKQKYQQGSYSAITKSEALPILNDKTIAISSHDKANQAISYSIVGKPNSPREQMYFYLSKVLLNKAYFYYIRNEKQLAYHVKTDVSPAKPYTITFSTQSSEVTSEQLLNESKKFISSYLKKLNKMDEQEFQKYVTVAKNSLLTPEPKIYSHTEKVLDYYLDNQSTEYKKVILTQLQKINLTSYISFFDQTLVQHHSIEKTIVL